MIPKEFFLRDARIVARELLGKELFFKGKRAIIVETEAYVPGDPGSHAYKGKTKRNEIMYEEGGVLYVYLCYGMYELMNIVTDKKGVPSAVLIRAVKPLNFKAKTNGPGLLTKALGITREYNGKSVMSKNLHLREGIKNFEIVQTTRIGLKNGKELPYRFYIKNCPFVSKA